MESRPVAGGEREAAANVATREGGEVGAGVGGGCGKKEQREYLIAQIFDHSDRVFSDRVQTQSSAWARHPLCVRKHEVRPRSFLPLSTTIRGLSLLSTRLVAHAGVLLLRRLLHRKGYYSYARSLQECKSRLHLWISTFSQLIVPLPLAYAP